jgi:hypothetical protein
MNGDAMKCEREKGLAVIVSKINVKSAYSNRTDTATFCELISSTPVISQLMIL